jgi:hypothetical protein
MSQWNPKTIVAIMLTGTFCAALLALGGCAKKYRRLHIEIHNSLDYESNPFSTNQPPPKQEKEIKP